MDMQPAWGLSDSLKHNGSSGYSRLKIKSQPNMVHVVVNFRRERPAHLKDQKEVCVSSVHVHLRGRGRGRVLSVEGHQLWKEAGRVSQGCWAGQQNDSRQCVLAGGMRGVMVCV